MGNHHADDAEFTDTPAELDRAEPRTESASVEPDITSAPAAAEAGEADAAEASDLPEAAADDSAAPPHDFGLFPPDSNEFDDDSAEPDSAAHLSALREMLAGRAVAGVPDSRTRPSSGDRQHGGPRRRKRHPVLAVLASVLVLLLLVGGIVTWVVLQTRGPGGPTDFAGAGSGHVIVRVQPGDGALAVGRTLVAAGVVADAQRFASQAAESGELAGLQPGYYSLHIKQSSATAITQLADPASRRGHLRIIPGQTLADLTVIDPEGNSSTRPGIVSIITQACVRTDESGPCFSGDELWARVRAADLGGLGLVGWALDAAAAAPDPDRRLEGMILPGDYDVPPGSTPDQALAAVVSASMSSWNQTDIVAAAALTDYSPYQLAVIASLVQAEGIGDDMPKVARVIYNRLTIDMKLQFDSTVNYGLSRAQISTTDAERQDPNNLYSTYAHAGLPPTPIGAPGPRALDAADNPAIGPWLYFVAIDLDGHTCFSETFAEHEKCIDQARANGVFG